ncbi:MAG: thymidine phosphorylase, partial [Kiritimatiellaeota bacterium]|nr:thymidine phosphorylase [Kiritimatiellota bacterium]
MLPQWIIEKKRDGAALTSGEIREFIAGFTAGAIPDYQMAALAMAIFFRGMTPDETAALTDAMMRSGDVLDTAAITAPKIDKHSTGGIGDKVSLVLAPLVACCGVAVPMISGRGLGITGGTLDKLESIPGYRTNLTTREFLDVVARCGC